MSDTNRIVFAIGNKAIGGILFMKKLIMIVLAVVLTMSTFITAMAEDKADFVISSVDVKNNIVEVPVYITALPEGIENIMAIDFEYDFDETVLRYVSATKGTASGALFISSSGSVHWADSTDLATGKAKITAEIIEMMSGANE